MTPDSPSPSAPSPSTIRPSPDSPNPGARRPKSAARFIVPLLLFIVIIGGIAWLAQNMPSWRSPRATNPSVDRTGTEPLLLFVHPYLEKRNAFMAMWERPQEGDNEPYAREFEKDDKGRYHFPFKVNSDQDLAIGAQVISCDCAELHVTVVSGAELQECLDHFKKKPEADFPENPAWTWTLLKRNDEKGIVLPAGAVALLRMEWKNKRGPGEMLNLSAQIWAAQGIKKHYFQVLVPASSTRPVRAAMDRVNVGIIGPGGVGKAEFTLWSPTRDNAELDFPDLKKDPLLEVKTEVLDAGARAALQARLRKEGVVTRVLSAWRLTVSVHEHQRGRWLAQGYFLRSLSVNLGDTAEDALSLLITGAVKGDVEIGGIEDQGKINLRSFLSKEGARKTIFLWTDKKLELETDSVHPPALNVKLRERAKEASASKKKWELEVDVPPNQLFGPIGEDNAVILRDKARPERKIRIPLMGQAIQG